MGVHGEDGARAVRQFPDRFVPSLSVDPNQGMDAVRAITKAYEAWGIRAVGMFPAGMFPQVPINDKKMYPIYAKLRGARHPGVRVRRRARAARALEPASTSSSSTRSASTSPSWCS